MKLSDGLTALTEMAKGVEACVEEYTREEQAKHRAVSHGDLSEGHVVQLVVLDRNERTETGTR